MIKDLENIKLIRELNYLKSEFEYKSNLIQVYSIDFFNWVENILTFNLELKQIYEDKKTLQIEQTTNVTIKQDDEIDIFEQLIEEPIQEKEDSNKLKGVYRQIVKLTHPDKIQSDSLNTIYNEANLAFKDGNTIDMILLCDRLGLPYNISEEEIDLVKKEILDIKNRILLLESTYPYQWANSDDEVNKNTIAINYIRKMII